jgi:hypothetical protein
MLRLLAGAASLGLGLFFIGGYVTDSRELDALRATGKPAAVQPIDGYTQRRDRLGTNRYFADFTFDTESGKRVTVRTSFPKELLGSLEARQPVTIHYMPANPSRARFLQDSPSAWMLGLGALLSVCGAGFLWAARHGGKAAPAAGRGAPARRPAR